MRANIGGLHFDELPRSYDDSFVIGPGGLGGWLSGVEVRRDEAGRPGAHGAFDAPGFLSARVVSIEGSIIASSVGVLNAMIAQLTGLLADGSMGRLTVQDDHGNATWAYVRLAGTTQIERFSSGTEAGFQVQFWAPDPRRFGESRKFGGGTSSTTVFHRGNFPAVPVIEVADVPSNYTVTAGGFTFRVTGATANGTHRIDMRTGRVTRDGVLMTGVASGDTWAIPTGARWEHTVSSGRIGVTVADTFI